MKTKILLWASFSILFVLVGYFLLPKEWQIIYSQIFISKTQRKISFPIKSVNINDVENTYGADRPGGRKHEGLDIFALQLTPILSASDGIILKTGRDVLGGNVVKVLGSDNRIYYYAHLSKYMDFKTDDEIKQGQTIGYVGNTGNAVSTPPHLHFEIMEIEWYFPLVTKNIYPYYELIDSNSVNYNLSNK